MRKILNQRENMTKHKYDKNLEPKKEKCKKIHKKNKKCLNKVEKFCLQIKQDPYFICTVSHPYLYKRSIKLFQNEKYHILTVESYCQMK